MIKNKEGKLSVKAEQEMVLVLLKMRKGKKQLLIWY